MVSQGQSISIQQERDKIEHFKQCWLRQVRTSKSQTLEAWQKTFVAQFQYRTGVPDAEHSLESARTLKRSHGSYNIVQENTSANVPVLNSEGGENVSASYNIVQERSLKIIIKYLPCLWGSHTLKMGSEPQQQSMRSPHHHSQTIQGLPTKLWWVLGVKVK